MLNTPQHPILVVEDDRSTAELEKYVLSRSGKSSHISSHVNDAVERIRHGRYSAVLLDYMLSDDVGWRVLEEALACTPPIPVIVVTGRGSEEVAVEALRRGAADYVIKDGYFWEELPYIVDRKLASAEQVRIQKQTQVLDAISGLAGGVAHVFNNLMTVIIGRSELVVNRLPPANALRSDMQVIINAGERASNVSKQLLNFSRWHMLRPALVNLNTCVEEAERKLCERLPNHIELEVSKATDLQMSVIDAEAVTEAILNLASNAEDAMPDGGKLVIETSNVVLNDVFVANNPGCKPGSYVKLVVSDNGCGIDPAVQSRIFEPFFTTGHPAQRVGLGLSMVYGTVKQSGGHICVKSEPQAGTRVEIFFPQAKNDPKNLSLG